jgi:predicted DsbA family dithiol-disulfide isomerase
MKERLFETNGEWGNAGDLAAAFEDHAAELGMDRAAFRECYDSGRATARWQQDVAVGQSAQVSGTPNFFIIRIADRSGTRVPGFIEFGQFQQVLDQLLAETADQ